VRIKSVRLYKEQNNTTQRINTFSEKDAPLYLSLKVKLKNTDVGIAAAKDAASELTIRR
jgi:hypothetical protein